MVENCRRNWAVLRLRILHHKSHVSILGSQGAITKFSHSPSYQHILRWGPILKCSLTRFTPSYLLLLLQSDWVGKSAAVWMGWIWHEKYALCSKNRKKVNNLAWFILSIYQCEEERHTMSNLGKSNLQSEECNFVLQISPLIIQMMFVQVYFLACRFVFLIFCLQIRSRHLITLSGQMTWPAESSVIKWRGTSILMAAINVLYPKLLGVVIDLYEIKI